MNLRHKIMSTTAVTLVLFALALVTALFGMQSTQNRFQHFIDVDQALLEQDTNMYAQGLQMGQALRNIIMDPNNETAYINMENAAKAFTNALDTARTIGFDQPQTLQMLNTISSLRERHIKEQQHTLAVANDQVPTCG